MDATPKKNAFQDHRNEEPGSQVCGPEQDNPIRSSAYIDNFATVRNVRQQYVDKGILAIKRWTSPIFSGDDSPDGREVALAKRVVLFPEKTLSPAIRLDRTNPVI